MHHLVPSFIVKNLRQGELSGSFSCAALFVDISGFTGVTEALMKHGQYGAEILAVVMRSVFTPLVDSVYQQGGFITGFAGDAFTAVFPGGQDQYAPAIHAVAAGRQMQLHMTANALQQTRFGIFEFSAKIGLDAGEANWGILLADNSDRATYYFRGSAIDGCVAAEHHASAGEMVIGQASYEALSDAILALPIGDHWHIEDITITLPRPMPVERPPIDVDIAARFVPRLLLERDIEGEFRQILNLFIGLSGTPSRDELTTFMQQVFDLQAQYGGFLNRIDFGDKGCHLLLFWGAPISHEQDLAHVLDFILELRRISAIPLRAGVTYRIAHAGYIGSALAEEYTCYGRGVNLAARQMTSTSWDDIWLDDQTARRARANYRVKTLGSRLFKGFDEPQNVYRLLDRRKSVTSRFEDKPMVGRQQELDVLQQAIQPIFDGQFAGGVIVTGEAGVGKSRLVDALCHSSIQDNQAAIFLCQANELLRQSLNPFRYFLTRYFNQSPADPADGEEVNKQRFFDKLNELRSFVSEPELGAELERTRSFLANLVGLRWENSLFEQLDPELRFENTLDALKAFFKAESLRQPVIIHLEDAHWWDQDTSTFLSRLSRNVDSYPFVLLITSREVLPETLFEPSVSQQSLHLRSLGKEALSELAAETLGHAPSPALLKLLVERTEGNPFFVEQILLYMIEHDLLETVEAGSGQALPGDVYIPTDVRAVLTARLDRLPDDIKDLVQKASILGHEFETPVLAAMIDNPDQLKSFLDTGETEKVWLNSGRANYIFRHALLRDAAYDMQLGARLRHLHRRAALAYEELYPDPARAPRYAEIAFHFDRAEETEQARHYYGSAGYFAKDEYRNEDAVAFFSRALGLTDETDYSARYQYLTARETIYQWLGQQNKQESDLKQLRKLLSKYPDDVALADLALRQSSYDLVTSGYEASVERVREALVHAQTAQDKLAEAKAYHRWGRTLWQQGHNVEAQTHLETALGFARTANDRSLVAECLVDLANTYRQHSHYNSARSLLEQAMELFEALQDEQGIIRCYTLLGVVDGDLGYFTDSEANNLRALNLAHETGWRFAETYILVNLGGMQFELGEYTKGNDYLNQALGLTDESGDVRTHANSLDTLGLIAHYEGQPAKAITYYDRAAEIYRSIDNSRELGYVLTHSGYAAIDLNQFGRAKTDLEEALRIRESIGADVLKMDTLAGLARLAHLNQRSEEAVDITSGVLSYITENGTDGIELPILVHLICYQVLIEAGKQDPSLLSRAGRVLAAGNALLEERLQRLSNQDARQRFLDNVPFNRAIRDLWLGRDQ